MAHRSSITCVTAFTLAFASAAVPDILLIDHVETYGGSSPNSTAGAVIVWEFGGESCTDQAPAPYIFWKGRTFTPDDSGVTFDIFAEDAAEFPPVAALLANGEVDFLCNRSGFIYTSGIQNLSYHGFAELAQFYTSPWINGWDFDGSIVTGMQLRIDELTIAPDPAVPGNTRLDLSFTLQIWGCPPPIQRGDSNLDGTVGVLDFLAVLSNWGETDHHPTDHDGDQLVGILDFLNMLSNWD